VTPQEVYDLLHGHVRAFNTAHADRIRAEAGLRIRAIRGQTNVLLRWIAENRERIEEDAVWAEARSHMLRPYEAAAAGERVVTDALGGEPLKGYDGSTYFFIDSPGYRVYVESVYKSGPQIKVTIKVRTDKDKPLHFTLEQMPAHARKNHNAARAKQREKLVLSGIDLFLPLANTGFATGHYAAPQNLADPQYQRVLENMLKENHDYAMLRENETEAQRRARVESLVITLNAPYSEGMRLHAPFLFTGEATFDLTFRHSPTKYESSDITVAVPGVTLETLADTIYNMIGVGFPKSPFFQG